MILKFLLVLIGLLAARHHYNDNNRILNEDIIKAKECANEVRGEAIKCIDECTLVSQIENSVDYISANLDTNSIPTHIRPDKYRALIDKTVTKYEESRNKIKTKNKNCLENCSKKQLKGLEECADNFNKKWH